MTAPAAVPAAPDTRPGPGAAATAWALALLVVACVPLATAFTSPVVLVPLVAATALPFGVVALARRLAVPAWATGVAGVTVVLAVATSFARLGQEGAVPAAATGWRSTGAAQVLGPVADAAARLLTSPRPAAPGLAVPVVALVALVALTVALAHSRRGPTRTAPLVGAVVVYGTALLLTAGDADRGAVGAALVALAAAGWALLDGDALTRRRHVPRLGRATLGPGARWGSGGLTGLLVVAVVAVTGATAGAAVTGRAFEPRDHVTPPQRPADVVHPLAELSRWQSDAEATVLRVRGSHPGYLTWVTLPDFDGAGWYADLDLRAFGAVAEPSLPAGRVQDDVDLEVELVDLAGPSGSPGSWLPSAGRVRATSAPAALVDVEAGVLAVPPAGDGRLPAGLTYRVRAVVDSPDPVAAARAGVPGGAEADRYLRLDRFPVDLRTYAQGVVAGSSSRLDQAERLAQTVRGERRLTVDAVSGSSYARLREFLFADAGAGGQVGTSEQFAGAFAVLARAVGLPSRVVLGFTVPGGAADDTGLRDVHGADVRAWAEVYLAGSGWVRFDPSPDAVSASSLDELVPEQGPGAPVQEDPPPAEAEVPPDAPTAEAAGAGSGLPRGALPLVAGALALVVLLGAVAATAGARWVRRRRLRRAGLVGAWQHATDALLLRDGPAARAATVEVLAGRMAELTGVATAELATGAQAAAFGPAAQASGGAWRVAVDVDRRLRAGAGRRRRLTWAWDRAPLRRRRGRGSAPVGVVGRGGRSAVDARRRGHALVVDVGQVERDDLQADARSLRVDALDRDLLAAGRRLRDRHPSALVAAGVDDDELHAAVGRVVPGQRDAAQTVHGHQARGCDRRVGLGDLQRLRHGGRLPVVLGDLLRGGHRVGCRGGTRGGALARRPQGDADADGAADQDRAAHERHDGHPRRATPPRAPGRRGGTDGVGRADGLGVQAGRLVVVGRRGRGSAEQRQRRRCECEVVGVGGR